MTTYAFAGEFAGALLDGAGRPRRSVAVTVLKAGVPATLYTDRTKTAQASNPVSTDSRGNVRFFADPGDYTIDGSPITVPVDPAEAVGATVQPINFWPVGSEANMLALSAHAGDIAVRLDINRNFGLQGSDPSVLGNWVELADPGDAAAILRAVLLAKGDLVGASAAGSPARIQVGADGLPLVAASGDGTGVHYAQLATGGIADGAVTAAKVAADVATQAELDAEATARVAADALLIPIAQKGAANGVASLDSGSKVPAAQLPSITISDFLGTVANQAAMLALSGQRGDWAIRSDTSTTWMLIGDDATQLANWKQLATPADAVSSVNGRTGAVTGLAEATDVTAEAAARAAATALLLAKAANLSDVANAATARTNLGLGTAATAASTDFEAAGSVAAEAALRATGDTTRVPNNQTADYTLVLADAGKVIEINAATGKNVTVPPNSAVAYPVNTIVWVQQLGAGAATAVAGAGVTLVGASLVTSGVGSGLLLRKTATNTWVVQATSSATSGASATGLAGLVLGQTGGVAMQPWKAGDPIGAELWAVANFVSGGGFNASTLTPSLTANSTAQTLRTLVQLGNGVNRDLAFRLVLTTIDTLTSGWGVLKVGLVTAGGVLIAGTDYQVISTHSVVNNGNEVIFEFLADAPAISGTLCLDVRLDIFNNAASGTFAISGVSVREVAAVRRPMLYTAGFGISGPSIFQQLYDPQAKVWRLARTDLNADSALTNSLGPVTLYNLSNPWLVKQPDPTFAQTAASTTDGVGGAQEVLPAGTISRAARVNNNDQVVQVQKADLSFELRGNTHGGETARSAAVFEVQKQDGTWITWNGLGNLLRRCRRVRFTFPTKLTRSAPDSDAFANVDHVATFFPDGVMRMDRTTTFLKDVTVGQFFEWMSSHDLTVPKVGRIGAGLRTVDEVDIHTRLAVPAAPTAAANNAAGSLAAATYRYAITALTEAGETTPSAAVTQAATGGTSTVTLTLPAAATGQTGWRVYGRANDQTRAVLLATLAASATTWADDGTVAAYGQPAPTVNTARRLDTTTLAQDAATSAEASWAVWKDLPTGVCFGNVYDRDAVVARTLVGSVKVRLEAGSGIVKNYQTLHWSGGASTTVVPGGTVFAATHWSFVYCPQDPNGRWEFEIAARAADLASLKTMYPAT